MDILVKDIEHLKELAKDGAEFYINISKAFRASKHIEYIKEDDRFNINHYIDGTVQRVKTINLHRLTNIVKAINDKQLYKD